MTLNTIQNMSGTRSIMVTEDMNSWINEFNNAAKLICASYNDESLNVGYKVRSLVMEGLCTELEHVLCDLADGNEFVVFWEQETDNDIYLEIELKR